MKLTEPLYPEEYQRYLEITGQAPLTHAVEEVEASSNYVDPYAFRRSPIPGNPGWPWSIFSGWSLERYVELLDKTCDVQNAMARVEEEGRRAVHHLAHLDELLWRDQQALQIGHATKMAELLNM